MCVFTYFQCTGDNSSRSAISTQAMKRACHDKGDLTNRTSMKTLPEKRTVSDVDDGACSDDTPPKKRVLTTPEWRKRYERRILSECKRFICNDNSLEQVNDTCTKSEKAKEDGYGSASWYACGDCYCHSCTAQEMAFADKEESHKKKLVAKGCNAYLAIRKGNHDKKTT